MYRITNTSKGPRGIWSGGRLVWLQPGESKSLVLDQSASVLRNPDFEAEPVGDVPELPKSLAEKASKPAARPRRKTTRRKKAAK